MTTTPGADSDARGGRLGRLEVAYASLLQDEESLSDVLGLVGEVRVRVGTDVQEVAPVEEALRTHAERYLARVFTDQEVASSGWPHAPLTTTAEALAARYAAKEAVIKVLRPAVGVAWREIEVRRQDGGWSEVSLSGAAAGLAQFGALSRWTLSFSHDGGVAVATVVALYTPTPPLQTRE